MSAVSQNWSFVWKKKHNSWLVMQKKNLNGINPLETLKKDNLVRNTNNNLKRYGEIF